MPKNDGQKTSHRENAIITERCLNEGQKLRSRRSCPFAWCRRRSLNRRTNFRGSITQWWPKRLLWWIRIWGRCCKYWPKWFIEKKQKKKYVWQVSIEEIRAEKRDFSLKPSSSRQIATHCPNRGRREERRGNRPTGGRQVSKCRRDSAATRDCLNCW